jgi:hypothetical protein
MGLEDLLGGQEVVLSYAQDRVHVDLFIFWILCNLVLNEELLHHLNVINEANKLVYISANGHLNRSLQVMGHGKLLVHHLVKLKDLLQLTGAGWQVSVQVVYQMVHYFLGLF